MKRRVQVSLPIEEEPELAGRLNNLAKATWKIKSVIVSQAIQDYLDRPGHSGHEDFIAVENP
ncbi:MAG: hypothetical protein WA140_02035 [Geobacteraceae bacterium]